MTRSSQIAPPNHVGKPSRPEPVVQARGASGRADLPPSLLAGRRGRLQHGSQAEVHAVNVEVASAERDRAWVLRRLNVSRGRDEGDRVIAGPGDAGLIGEAISAILIRDRCGNHDPGVVVHVDSDPGQSRLSEISNAVVVDIIEDNAGDLLLHIEDIALQVGDSGVALDDLGQGGRLHKQLHLLESETLVEEEEAIAVAEGGELLGEDRFDGRTHVGAGEMVLGQHALEGVDLVDGSISGLELGLDGRRCW